MVASHVRRVSVLALLVVPALALAAQRIAPAACDAEYVVESRFLTAVDAYVVLHHRLFEPLSEEFMCLPADSIAVLNALADVPREARPAPREGDIFSPDVADLFRRRIAATLQAYEYNPADVLAEMDVEELVALPVRVNEALPRGLGLMMPWLAGALPVLPEELAYRLVGHDFVLIDVQSNLVVDVIRAVLALCCTTSSATRLSRGSVDARGKRHRKPLPQERIDERMGEPRGKQRLADAPGEANTGHHLPSAFASEIRGLALYRSVAIAELVTNGV